MELDKLLVKIEADLSDLKRGLDKANNQVKKSSNQMSNSMQKFGTTLDNVGGRVLKFGGLIAGAFGAIQIKKVIDVGRQIEDLQVRLKALFGTAEEGARAFDVMVKFASRVPFTLSDIQQASGNLAVVAKDANELAEILEITGNVAGATGLSFTQTAEQIQRSFSGGIASADVFRERGVRNMLGFQAGAEVSVNETVKRFKEVFGKGGEFGNVTDDLANTLTGTLSMLEDKLFQFRKAVADEFVTELRNQLGDLNKALEDSQEEIVEFGTEVGKSLANLSIAVVENFETIKVAVQALGAFLLTSVLYKVLTDPRFAGLLALLAFVNEYQQAEKRVEEQQKKTNRALEKQNDALEVNSKEFFEAIKNARDYNNIQQAVFSSIKKVDEAIRITLVTQGQLKEITDEVSKTFEDAGEQIATAFGDSIAKGQDFGDAMKKIFQDVVSQIIATIAQILIITPLIEGLTKKLNAYQEKQKGGIGFDLGGVIGGAITGMLGFQNGGYTPPNKPYLVGERGAEVFVPRTAGNIIPNNQMGGGVTVNQNISFSTGIVPTVRAEVLNLLPTIKQETINAVAETRSRGGAFARTFGA
jgi:tetratricopeptide (TPR) repeat protein